ncbi:MAG: arginine deiminase-related protein [Pirellulaceae bacterium]|nr:arginine deiminase-related protein [Pirellulaceae bacterium]
MSTPRILMCPPDHYGIEYEINPWMSRSRQADRPLAITQWRALRDILTGLGVKVELLEPVAGLPDLVFTANAAMIYRRRAILSHFRHQQRQGEEPLCAQWFAEQGFAVERLPEGRYFEGAGDALFCGDTLVAGYRIRSDVRSQQLVGQLVEARVVPVELVDEHYYHLDTCFCPLAPGRAIWFPGAFDDYGRRALVELVPELIEVAAEEAQSFACNAVVVGRHVVTNSGCPGLHRDLAARGYTPIATPLSEFVKAGGSAKCLTLRLDGEEAAGWKAGR